MKKIIDIFKNQDSLEYEFLSPALEIVEKPPSLLSKFTIKIVFAILIVILLISSLGKVDIVASASGKIIPSGRLQTIQPMEEGEIVKINVAEGAFVKKGQVLIELNGTVKETNYQEAKKNLIISNLEKELAISELNNSDMEAVINNYSNRRDKNGSLVISTRELEYQKSLVISRKEEYLNKEKSLLLTIDQLNSELNLNYNEKERIKKDIEYWTEEEEITRKLFEIGNIARTEWKTKEKELRDAQKELNAIDIKIVQNGQKIEETKKTLNLTKEERRKTILESIVELDKRIVNYNSEVIRTEQSYRYQKLTAPVNGTIHGLSSYTIGGILQPAETAITLVPEGTEFIAEIMILNKDIGFIKDNQEVELKIDAFSFQKFGTIHGRVINISPDAIEDERKGYVYKAIVSMDKNYFLLEGSKRLITPGMTMTAEIKTGKRRIIEFFLSPLIKNVDEGLKVR